MEYLDDKLKLLRSIRANFVRKVERFDLATLNEIPPGFNNNLIWNFGHVIITHCLLTYGLAKINLPMEGVLVDKYKKGTRPVSKISQIEIDQLKGLAVDLVDKFESDYKNGKFQTFNSYSTNFGFHIGSLPDALDFNNLHEGMHIGFCNAMIKFLA